MLGRNKHRVCLSLVGMLVLGVSSVAHAAPLPHKIYVGTCFFPSAPTIQAAVNGVAPGGVVDVCPGTYPEQVMINQSLTLAGVTSGTGAAAVVVPPVTGMATNGSDIFGNPVSAQIFVQNSTGVIIQNLTVDGTGNNIVGCVAATFEGIYFQNSSGTIRHNVVRNQFQTDYADYGGCQNGLAINVESETGSSDVTVASNSVRAFQKNGITATGSANGTGSPGPVVLISGNYIVGLAATAMNWQPGGGAAENGIQVGFGATGTVTQNTVNDNIWGPDTFADTGDAASGILIYASQGFNVTANKVNSAQFGIVADSDPTYGTADGTKVSNNLIAGTQIFDAVDLCSSTNTAQSNTIFGSAESGIHIDDSCGSGNNNTVTSNVINEACAGILLGANNTGNTTSPNTFDNVVNTTLSGDTCTSPTYAPAARIVASTSHKTPRPSPYKPMRR
jgi:hypothetical protein